MGGRNDASLASYSQRATQRAEPFPRQEDEPERSEAERASFLLPHFAIEKIIRGRGPDKYTLPGGVKFWRVCGYVPRRRREEKRTNINIIVMLVTHFLLQKFTPQSMLL